MRELRVCKSLELRYSAITNYETLNKQDSMYLYWLYSSCNAVGDRTNLHYKKSAVKTLAN